MLLLFLCWLGYTNVRLEIGCYEGSGDYKFPLSNIEMAKIF